MSLSKHLKETHVVPRQVFIFRAGRTFFMNGGSVVAKYSHGINDWSKDTI